MWKGVSAPPFFFHPSLFDIPPFFMNITCNLPPLTPPPWHHPSQGNTRFYDDTLEWGRLKTINTKPWKAITYRTCVLSTKCVLIDIIVNCCANCHWMQLPSCWSWHQVPSQKNIYLLIYDSPSAFDKKIQPLKLVYISQDWRTFSIGRPNLQFGTKVTPAWCKQKVCNL